MQSVRFSRDSWHAKLYAYVYDPESDYTQINFCRYFWRIVGGVFLLATGGVVFTFCSLFIAPLFGYIPRSFTFPMLPFEGWEKECLRKYKARVYPWPFLLVISLFWLLYPFAIMLLTEPIVWEIGGAVGLAILLVIGAVVGVSKIRRAESWQLLKTFLEAKKEKVCPLIDWID